MEEILNQILLKLEHIEREQGFLKKDLSALSKEVSEVKEKQKDMSTQIQLNHEETMNELDIVKATIKNIPPTYEVNEKLLGEHASILSEHETDIKMIKKILTNQ